MALGIVSWRTGLAEDRETRRQTYPSGEEAVQGAGRSPKERPESLEMT